MNLSPTESRLEVDIKYIDIDQFKPGLPPISKSRNWTQRRWAWIMDAVADEQNKSPEDWRRNVKTEGGGGLERQDERGGWWVGFIRVIGQLVVWWP